MKILVCINKLEKKTFLPASVWADLEALDAAIVLQDSDGMDTKDLAKCLSEIRPEVLISAWSTPCLPESQVDQTLEYLKLQTHLPGSLKKVIPRVYLEKGLLATNWGGSISRTISECALMLILCSLRRTAKWQIEMHTGNGWKNSGSSFLSLFERRVGIHGFGAIGQALVPLLKPFKVKISAYSPSVPKKVFSDLGVHKCETLEELFSESDVLVELAPNTPKYFHSVTEKLLRMLPENGVFVNVGRGATVDEMALGRIAQEGNLQIGLDVYEEEPLPSDSLLRGLKNVCLLPHIGGPTIDRRQDAGRHAISIINNWMQGIAPEEAVSAQAYDRAT